MNCLFCKIIDKKIPASITFENDNYLDETVPIENESICQISEK